VTTTGLVGNDALALVVESDNDDLEEGSALFPLPPIASSPRNVLDSYQLITDTDYRREEPISWVTVNCRPLP
jgi:hypothetical protein